MKKASWQNHYFEWIENLPIPAFFFHLLMFVFLSFFAHLLPWMEGKLPWWEFDIAQLNFLIWFPVVFFGAGFFLNYSKLILKRFRPALIISDEEYVEIEYQFIHVSSRTGWVITIMGIIFSFLAIQNSMSYQRDGLSSIGFLVSATFMFSVVFFFFYYLLRALSMTRELYARIDEINIFHLTPLYAFSGFSSRVGMFFVFASTLSYVTNVVLVESPTVGVFVFFASLNITIAIIAFIYPLFGIHERLESVKIQANAENDHRLLKARNQLHSTLDSGGTTGILEIKNAISGLIEIRHEMRSISTWPWDFATLRNFITALFIPIILWLIQSFLSQYINF